MKKYIALVLFFFGVYRVYSQSFDLNIVKFKAELLLIDEYFNDLDISSEEELSKTLEVLDKFIILKRLNVTGNYLKNDSLYFYRIYLKKIVNDTLSREERLITSTVGFCNSCILTFYCYFNKNATKYSIYKLTGFEESDFIEFYDLITYMFVTDKKGKKRGEIFNKRSILHLEVEDIDLYCLFKYYFKRKSNLCYPVCSKQFLEL